MPNPVSLEPAVVTLLLVLSLSGVLSGVLAFALALRALTQFLSVRLNSILRQEDLKFGELDAYFFFHILELL